MFKIIIAVFFLLSVISIPIITVAQNNAISGTIAEAKTGSPLPGTNVYLDGTTIGTQADENGTYVLENIPDGTFTIVFSFVGFESFTKQLIFNSNNRQNFDVTLKNKTLNLGEVIVKADDPKEWRRNLEKFKKHFIGFTRNAGETSILNPGVLDFKTTDRKFIAFAEEPLKIKNKALGYEIKFYLKKFILNDFTIQTYGNSRFNPLTPKDKNQHKAWKKGRERTYKGSYRHFINALTAGTLREEGFVLSFTNSLRYINRKITGRANTNLHWPDRLFKYERIGRIAFSFYKNYKFLRVDYLKERPEMSIVRRANYNKNYHQVSFIELPKGKAIIDIRSASEISPYRAKLFGYWGWTQRISDLLPKDYKPED